MHKIGKAWIILALLLAVPAVGQDLPPDSTSFPAEQVPDPSAEKADSHSPEGALRRSLILPGWGQYYNGDTWKVPVVYAALGGTIGTAFWYRSRHRTYRQANLYKESAERVANGLDPVYPEYLDFQLVYEEISPSGTIPSSSLRQQRDVLRRNRDLLFIASVGVYGLSIIEAYIRAHLLDFDVDEDLSLGFRPTPEGPLLTAKWNF